MIACAAHPRISSQGDINDAKALFNLMLSPHGPCRPNAVTFSALISAYLARGDFKAVKQVCVCVCVSVTNCVCVYVCVCVCFCRPNAIAFSALISAYLARGDFKVVKQVRGATG